MLVGSTVPVQIRLPLQRTAAFMFDLPGGFTEQDVVAALPVLAGGIGRLLTRSEMHADA